MQFCLHYITVRTYVCVVSVCRWLPTAVWQGWECTREVSYFVGISTGMCTDLLDSRDLMLPYSGTGAH